jgi:hypothetical protein
MIQFVPGPTADITIYNTVLEWSLPANEPFVTYEKGDFEWCRYFGIGELKPVVYTSIIRNLSLLREDRDLSLGRNAARYRVEVASGKAYPCHTDFDFRKDRAFKGVYQDEVESVVQMKSERTRHFRESFSCLHFGTSATADGRFERHYMKLADGTVTIAEFCLRCWDTLRKNGFALPGTWSHYTEGLPTPN